MRVLDQIRRVTAIMALPASCGALLLVGCHRSAASPGVASPNGNSDAAAVDNESAQCTHVRKALCETAGQRSSECRSAQYMLRLLSPKACAALLDDEKNIVSRLRVVREPCLTLVERLCRDLGSETDVCKVVQAQTAAFSVERCSSMLARYDDVLSTLKDLEQGTRVLTLTEQTLVAEGNRPSFGPLNAKVVLVEFSDFQCPYCRGAAETTRQVQMRFGNQVRFVFRQFPLAFHPQAHLAAEAALAAHAQGKFWDFHDVLFAHQNALTRGELEKYAAAVGLDLELFRKNLEEHQYASDVAEDIGIGNRVHVSGTPTLFINGRRIANPSNTPAVLKAVHDALVAELSRSKNNQVMLP